MELSELHARMADGRLYLPTDESLQIEQTQRLELLYEYNTTRPSEAKRRTALLQKMFKSIGEGCYLEPPFHANWAGKHVTFGKNVYANFNLTLVDDGEITVGDCCMFGPNVTITTGGHPVDPSLRRQAYQYNLPIHIGNNVWIGAGAVLLPGVTIGDNTVIGAGSIVTKDIPANVVAVGNPCRVMREITEQDKLFYRKGRPVEL